jgi:hypothetical protein
VTAGFAVVFGSSVVVYLSLYLNLLTIFAGMGAFSLVVGVLMIFGIKDVIRLKN